MKILIFGIVASGKTTLAGELSERLGISWYEGDCIARGYPGEERYKWPPEEQRKRIGKIDESGSWIVEGTYRESQQILYDLADMIIFLDTPLYIRKVRIVTRFFKQKLGLEKSHYKADFNMLKWMFRWTREFEAERAVHEARLRK